MEFFLKSVRDFFRIIYPSGKTARNILLREIPHRKKKSPDQPTIQFFFQCFQPSKLTLNQIQSVLKICHAYEQIPIDFIGYFLIKVGGGSWASDFGQPSSLDELKVAEYECSDDRWEESTGGKRRSTHPKHVRITRYQVCQSTHKVIYYIFFMGNCFNFFISAWNC